MVALMMTPQLQLPWESTVLEDRLFQQVLRFLLIAFAVLSLVVPLLPVTELTREQAEQKPPQLARVILDKKVLPKPEPPKPVIREPEPPPVEKPEPRPKPKIKPRAVDKLAQARKVAVQSGVLAFRDDLSDMRDSLDVSSLNQQQMRRGQARATATERAVITSGRHTGSGGIQTAALSRDTGGVALSGRETTKVQSTLASRTRETGQSESVRLGGRSDESIRRVMDRNKAALFAIYNRALRRDPLLQGKLVFEMVIDPGGAVTKIKLVDSELSDRQLTSKILSRIRLINFGAEDVERTRVNYSFDFLPYS